MSDIESPARPWRRTIVAGVVAAGIVWVSSAAFPASAATTSWQVTQTYATPVASGALSIDEVAGVLYTANYGGSTVVAQNIATGAVIATIPVGAQPSATAIDPGVHRLYVTNYLSNTVSIIDTATNTVVGTVSGGDRYVSGVAVDRSAHKAYVTADSTNFAGQLTVIDGATDTATTLTPAGLNSSQFGISVDQSTGMVWTISQNGAYAQSVDPTNGYLVSAPIPVGGNPQGAWVNSATDRVYTADYGTNTVSVIDGSTDTVIATIPVGVRPSRIAVNEADDTIAVTNSGDMTISIIDGASNTVLQTVPMTTGDAGPYAVAWDTTRTAFYVTTAQNISKVAQGVSPTITSLVAPGGTVGHSYAFSVTATGTPDISYAITGGALPAGVSLDPSTGVISGIPTATGTFTFSIAASNQFPSADTHTYTVEIVAPNPPLITTTSLPGGTTGTTYDHTIAATGAAPISFAVTSGSLPAGLSLDSETGAIVGTPTAAGTASFTITATNSDGADSREYSLEIVAAPTPTPTPTSSATPVATSAAAVTGGSNLAVTGTSVPWLLLGSGVLMLIAGLSVVRVTRIFSRRR